ncbi:MAG TPA: hypothetical protein ENK26_08520 [Gammaproteobacteria bacterium]|nr:hypothetical protein [Gammaproteobacteria bacterium]
MSSLFKPSSLKPANRVSPGESLWKRVPTRTPEGVCVCDFMLLIPGLNKRMPPQIEARIDKIALVLNRYDHAVVFADLNLKLNILWVSYRPEPGLSFEIAAAVQQLVPETRIISMKLE